MFEQILVPLDGSQLAEVALPYAEEMAGRLGSEIILLSVAESASARDYHRHQVYIGKIIDATKRRAERYLDRSGGNVIKVEPKIMVGNAAEKILQYADKVNIGLIIMATHGRSGVERWAMGSVADKVVRSAKWPVALIRAKGAHSDVREKGILGKALVPLDGSKESEAVIPFIENLASRLKTEVTLLQVVAEPYRVYADAENYLGEMVGVFGGDGITVKSEVRVGTAAEGIITFADEAGADMVAMSTHGRSGIGRWAMGSIAERVVRGGNTPVLLVRSPGAITE